MVARRRRRYTGSGRAPKAHASGPTQMAPGLVGVRRRGKAVPTAHEQAVISRVALGFLLVTFREGGPPLYTYEDGTAIRNDNRGLLTKTQFNRLAQWLVPEKRTALFEEMTAQRWFARRPPQ